MKYWDAETGELLMTTIPMTFTDDDGNITDTGYVNVTPDGYFDASGNALNYVYYVRGLEIIGLEINLTFYAYGEEFWTGILEELKDKIMEEGEGYFFGHCSFSLDHFGTYGFHPVDAWYFHTGKVKDDSDYINIAEDTFTTEITVNDFIKIEEEWKEWYYDPPIYNLGENDCTSFCLNIADAADLDYGMFIQTPTGFIESLKHNNDD
jgi:hypothetical protein